MKVEVLASSTGGERLQFAATYRIDSHVVIDAGSLGFATLATQQSVRDVFLSHSHLDHVSSLPIFIDNLYAIGAPPPRIHATAEVLRCLRDNFFNDAVWPDLERLARAKGIVFAEFHVLEPEVPIQVDDLTILPVELDHVVPCLGFIVKSRDVAVAVISDTGPTERIWEVLRNEPHLRAIFLEAAVPNHLEWLAREAKHLSPRLFLAEYQKIGCDLPVLAVHIKPAYHEQVVQELQALNLPQLVIAEPQRVYEF